MTENQKQFLTALIDEPGPSGFEENVQKLWKNEVKEYCSEIRRDVHGNLTAVVNPGADFSIMIVGHADEIGLVVTYIDDNGFIYFQHIGGVDQSILGSQRARILTKKGVIEGVFGQKSLHQEPERVRKMPKRHEVYIDIGAKSGEEASKYVMIGDPIIYGNDYRDLKNNLASGRCFDNRIGIYISAEVTKRIFSEKPNITLYGVSSVQEECGVWGAGNAAYHLEPTMAIAIDVMPSTDYPGVLKEEHGDFKLGKGPVIRRGVRANNRIADIMINAAISRNIPYQIDMDNGHFGTDSDPISKIKSGIPVGGMEIATRYLHSSEEVLSLDDLDHAVELLTNIIIDISKDKTFLTREPY